MRLNPEVQISAHVILIIVLFFSLCHRNKIKIDIYVCRFKNTHEQSGDNNMGFYFTKRYDIIISPKSMNKPLLQIMGYNQTRE